MSVITSRQLYEDAARQLPARETIAGVCVLRVPTSRFGRRNLVGRSLDYLSFYVSAAWCLWRLVRPGDVVIAKTDPPMLSVLAVPIARLRGARAVNWLQDIFPEVAERLGVGARGRAGRAALALLRRLRDRSLRRPMPTSCWAQRMADHLAGLGVARERIVTIPNWADGRTIAPVAPAANALRRQWGLEDRFVVGYSGNLGRAHDIDTILDAIALIDRAQTAPARPRARGSPGCSSAAAAGSMRCASGWRRCDSTSVRFEPYQPRERLAESLSVADVHLVSLRPELEGLIVPSKFYGIAAAGRPAIFIGDRRRRDRPRHRARRLRRERQAGRRSGARRRDPAAGRRSRSLRGDGCGGAARLRSRVRQADRRGALAVAARRGLGLPRFRHLRPAVGPPSPALLQERAVGVGQTLAQTDPGAPSERLQLFAAHQLARRAVGLARVVHDRAREADDLGDEARQILESSGPRPSRR